MLENVFDFRPSQNEDDVFMFWFPDVPQPVKAAVFVKIKPLSCTFPPRSSPPTAATDPPNAGCRRRGRAWILHRIPDTPDSGPDRAADGTDRPVQLLRGWKLEATSMHPR